MVHLIRLSLSFLIIIAMWQSVLLPAALAFSGNSAVMTASTYPNAGLLVDAKELNTLISDPDIDLIIVDMRSHGFRDSRIPGAISIPGPGALSDPDHDIQNYLMNTRQFAELMGRSGISRDSDLVIYDEGGGLGATRLFYALELFGHPGSIRLLNGGLTAWKHHDFPMESGETGVITPAMYEPGFVESLICDVAYISKRMGSDDFILYDARSADEYEGRDRRSARGGHIPGAVNVEWSKSVSSDEIPLFLPGQELAEMLSGYGITPDKEVVPYCQSNVRGAHVYFTLRLMGFDSVRPYEGSWSEYGNIDGVPID